MLGFLALLSYIENPLALAVACHRFVCWHSQGDIDDVTCNRLRHFEEYSYACSGWRKDKSQDGCLCCGSGFCCGLLCSGGSSFRFGLHSSLRLCLGGSLCLWRRL